MLIRNINSCHAGQSTFNFIKMLAPLCQTRPNANFWSTKETNSKVTTISKKLKLAAKQSLLQQVRFRTHISQGQIYQEMQEPVRYHINRLYISQMKPVLFACFQNHNLECPRGPKPSFFRKYFIPLCTVMGGKKEIITLN